CAGAAPGGAGFCRSVRPRLANALSAVNSQLPACGGHEANAGCSPDAVLEPPKKGLRALGRACPICTRGAPPKATRLLAAARKWRPQKPANCRHQPETVVRIFPTPCGPASRLPPSATCSGECQPLPVLVGLSWGAGFPCRDSGNP